MDKTESNDSEQQPKRPSARRQAPEPIDPTFMNAKRVHARRAQLQSEPPPDPLTRPSLVARAQRTHPTNPSRPASDRPSRPAAQRREPNPEARAARDIARDERVAREDSPAVRAAMEPKLEAVTELNPESPAVGDVESSAQPVDSDVLEPRVASASHQEVPVSSRPPTAAASAVWHSDAAGPGRERESSAPRASGTALVRQEASDEFGLDDRYESKLRPWLETLCQRYFRVELHGAQHVPRHGRALLVSNHSRSLVWDGLILRTALRLHHDTGRETRWLVDDQQYHAPFLGTIINRLGAVRACQENAERLLLREEVVAVFPEGAKAAEKRYEERHRLHRFGRGGYVKLALRTGAPVLPVAIVARANDEHAWVHRLGGATRILGASLCAIRPGVPRLGQLGMPPMSTHFRISIGEPIREISRQDADATGDDGLVHELNEFVRGAVQNLVDETLRA